MTVFCSSGDNRCSSERSTFFPLSKHAWIEASTDTETPALILARSTRQVLAENGLWNGLVLLHEAVAKTEFINKRLAVADELRRLESRAAQSEAAGREALDSLAGVLSERTDQAELLRDDEQADLLLEAFTLVADSLGIETRPHPEPPERASFDEAVGRDCASVRCAHAGGEPAPRLVDSTIRVRWWPVGKTRWSPWLCSRKGSGSYEVVDVKRRSQVVVDADVADRIFRFAQVLYRPFPPGVLGAADLIRFGVRGLSSDVRTALAVAAWELACSER